MINEISRILEQFRSCFSRSAAFNWFVVVIFGFMVRLDHHGVSSFVPVAVYKAPALHIAAFVFQVIVVGPENYPAPVVADCSDPLSVS
jgi:hypothetical protein